METSKGVTPYQTKKGQRFLAQCRVKGFKTESQSFGSRPEALAWKKKREVELSGQAPERESGVPKNLTMGDLFTLYTEMHPKLPQHQVDMFRRLKAHPILQNVLVTDMCFSVMLAYCKARKADGMHPSTVQSEFVRVSVSIQGVADDQAWDENFIHPLTGARRRLKKLKLIADSTQRTRRPIEKNKAGQTELEALTAYATEQGDTVLADIIDFQAVNGFRRGETFALRWSDFDVEGSQIASSRKDASALEKGKRGARVPLRGKALAIILRQPRVEGEDRIFPHSASTVGKRFLKACMALNKLHGGKFCLDLRLHDLRHEAITVAAQTPGITTAQLKSFTGHKTERNLWRYTNESREDIANTARIMA